MAVEVRDHLSNTPEHIEELAKALGKGHRRAVFLAIYRGKKRTKTVSELMKVTRLTHVRVLQCGGELADRGFVEQTKVGGETAYRTIRFFQVTKRKMLGLNKNRKALERFPTKRKVSFGSSLPRRIVISTKGADAKRITIDDIDTFYLVRPIKPGESMPATVSEKQFKKGVQAIVGEAGEFKDWGGEDSDLYSSRLRVGGRRRTAAFAFKGPGEKGKLVPGKMGKNGDQAQRMFRQEADIFLVQHWREIDPSVLELLRGLAVAKSLATGKTIWFGVIDGQDSQRLLIAYPKKFEI